MLASPRLRKNLALVLILWLAFGLRIYQLTAVPPGLTHDEANHGREAIGILDGDLRFFFPLNYGSEPVYSYTVAGSMGLLGENLFALRWVNIILGLLALCAAYRWVTFVFDERVGLITAVLIAVSFWPLASSREALRAGMLPFFMVGAAWFYWQRFLAKGQGSRWQTVGFGTCVAVTVHIYLASRVAWLIFPLFLAYLLLLHRPQFKQMWQPTLLGLLLTGILVTPLFAYIEANPEVLTRLDMLDGPLQNLREGQVGPLLQTSSNAFLAFFWPGKGDQFLAYNIPGRPTLDGITAVFFLAGLAICLWRWRDPRYAFLLLWFGVGIVPSLITGPTANTTRNLAALPALYMLPAVGFVGIANFWSGREQKQMQQITAVQITAVVALLWLSWAGWVTVRDYFGRWGESAEVRGAYQQTLVTALDYLETTETADTVVLSTVYPGPVHDSSIGLVLAAEAPWASRWIDARQGLLLPANSEPDVIVMDSTAIHPYFQQWLHPVATVNLRPDDLDPAFTHYQFDVNAFEAWLAAQPVANANFDDGVELLTSAWLADSVTAAGVAELLTVWRVLDPTRVGALPPPAYVTEATLFTHVLHPDGSILTQRDSLEVPSWHWQENDLVIQIHPVTIPQGTTEGRYETVVGLYDSSTGSRLAIVGEQGQVLDTRAFVTPLTVAE